MPFLDLPAELIQQVAEYLYPPDLASLLRCNGRLKELVSPALYRTIELRLLWSRSANTPKIKPLALLQNIPADYFNGTQSIAIIGDDHFFTQDYSEAKGCWVLDRKKKEKFPVTRRLLDIVRKVPHGQLQSFEYKCVYPIYRFLFRRVFFLQPNISSLSLSLHRGNSDLAEVEIRQIRLPGLKRLLVRDVQRYYDLLLIQQLIRSAESLNEVDLTAFEYPGFGGDDLEEFVYDEILKQRPEILRLARFDLKYKIYAVFPYLEELHLRLCKDTYGTRIGNRKLKLKRLLVTTGRGNQDFYINEILAKTQTVPGLEEFHFRTQDSNNSLLKNGVRDDLPVPVDLLLRFKNTLKYVSLFEHFGSMDLMIDAGPACSGELKLLTECKELREYATAVNFQCSQRTPAYWKQFDMNSADSDYSHFASLIKLYLVPDMKILQAQIDSEQDEFWDLNPRNNLTYQIASIVLTNIALYSPYLPKIRWMIIGNGNEGRGQKVYEVVWSEYTPVRKKGDKGPKKKWLFTLSDPYEMWQLWEEGVKFRCFEGTRFNSDEETRVRSFW